MAWRQCPKRLWLQIHQPELARFDEAVEERFAAGHRVGEIARKQFPNGHLIGSVHGVGEALGETQRLLAASGDITLFEPAFTHAGALVRADVLERLDGAYRLVEVKSSASVKEIHLSDVAVQSWVIRGQLGRIDHTELAHIDTSFVYPGDSNYEGLLRRVDVAEQCAPLLDAIPQWIASAQQVVDGPVPETRTGEHCNQPYECEFRAHCSVGEPEYPLTLLPNGGKTVRTLVEQGFRDLTAVPAERLTNPVHQRILRATVAGRNEVDVSAAGKLAALAYPRYYLDFETLGPAIPIWPGTRPFEAIPVQWSCHVERTGGAIDHHECLVTSGDDPRREFAESLLAAMGNDGPVLVYNAGFEGRIIRELAAHFPDLSVSLDALVGRIFDLWPFTKQHYYHPAMKGSWSLKAVLPTIAPELAYQTLGIVRSGGDVEATYLEMIGPHTARERRAEIEAALRTYCARDTWALVRLVRFFLASRPAD